MSQVIMIGHKMTFFEGLAMFLFCFLFFCGVRKFSDWIRKPKEFVVTKEMKPEKRIVTDGIKVDTVLVYKLP